MTLFYEDCKNFPQLAQYIRSHTPQEFISQVTLAYVVEVSPVIKATLPLAKQYPAKPEEIETLKTFSCYTALSSGGDPISVYDFTLHLIEHLDSYEKAYQLFQDEWSQNTFFHMILFRLVPYTGTYLDKMRGDSFLYFRQELLEEKEQGVLVDVGAYLGNSVLNYTKAYGENYKKIYLFEPNPVSLARCKERTSSLSSVVYSSVPLSHEEGTAHLHLQDNFTCLHPEKGESIPTTTLDQAVTEPISFLKVDVAGSELSVLQGATTHLSQDKPNIAVAAGYLVDDLYAIPLFLQETNPNQTFFLRYHGLKDSTIGFVFYGKPSKAAVLSNKLKDSLASFGGLVTPPTVTPAAPVAAPVTSPVATPATAPVSDLDAQLNAAIASLSGTVTPPAPVTTPVATPATAPVSDLDAQLNAAIASLSGTVTPAAPVTATAPPVSDLDAQLNAALASLSGTVTPPAPVPATAPPVSDLNAQLSAALASLGGTITPPTPDLNTQLNAIQAKLQSMSQTLEQVTGQSTPEAEERFNIQSSAKGLQFTKIQVETPAPALPVVPTPVTSGHLMGERTQKALDLIQTMTDGVLYLCHNYQTNDPVYGDIVEALGLSLDALKGILTQES